MIKLIHGDCLEKMKDIPDKSIDMILTDLPFGTTACKWDVVIPFNKYVQIGKKVIYEQEYVFDKMKSGVSYKEALEDFLSVSKDGLWDNYKRIIKDRGAIVLFGSQPFTSKLVNSNLDMFKYEIIWEKDKASNFMLAKRQIQKHHENVLVFYKNQCTYNPIKWDAGRASNIGGSAPKLKKGGITGDAEIGKYNPKTTLRYPKSILKFNTPKANDKLNKCLHPTQKPVPLFEYLIKTYTNEGETVLDNCAGSFTTAIACLNTKRSFIGIEKDAHYFQVGKDRVEKYFEIAKKRIEETKCSI